MEDQEAAVALYHKQKYMNKRINTEIIINASAERVWKVLTDFHPIPLESVLSPA